MGVASASVPLMISTDGGSLAAGGSADGGSAGAPGAPSTSLAAGYRGGLVSSADKHTKVLLEVGFPIDTCGKKD